jgi:hypothetical protein
MVAISNSNFIQTVPGDDKYAQAREALALWVMKSRLWLICSDLPSRKH